MSQSAPQTMLRNRMRKSKIFPAKKKQQKESGLYYLKAYSGTLTESVFGH